MRRVCIVIDTREQKPLDFSQFADIRTETVTDTCWPGDYSLKGAPNYFAVERKSVSDLIGTMKDGYAGPRAVHRRRFDKTLLGLSAIRALGGDAFVIVEPDALGFSAEDQIRAGNYRAGIEPRKVEAFVETMRTRWRVPVVMATSREHAAEIVATAARAAAAKRRINEGMEDLA